MPEKSQQTAASKELSANTNIAAAPPQLLIFPLLVLRANVQFDPKFNCCSFRLPFTTDSHEALVRCGLYSAGLYWYFQYTTTFLQFLMWIMRMATGRATHCICVHGHVRVCVFPCVHWLSGTSDRCARKSLFIFPEVDIECRVCVCVCVSRPWVQ